MISGTVTGTSTAISFDNTSHDNAVDLKSTAIINGNLAGSGSDTVKLSGTTNGSFDLNKIASGFTQLVKNDISTWAVTGRFAGDAAVNGGVLQVDGTLGGFTTVGDGLGNPAATLDGVGTLAGISVQNNGILAPGDAGVGTLTFGGNLTMVNGAALQIRLAARAATTYSTRAVPQSELAMSSSALRRWLFLS